MLQVQLRCTAAWQVRSAGRSKNAPQTHTHLAAVRTQVSTGRPAGVGVRLCKREHFCECTRTF